MVECLANGCRCQSNVALSQSHQRESRLWIPPGLPSCEECLLRAWEVTQLESNAAQFGEGPAELPPQIGSKLRACCQNLLLGLGGGPAQPEDLGTVHAASAMGAADSAYAAPPLHRLGPLLGEIVLTKSLEHAHQLAI